MPKKQKPAPKRGTPKRAARKPARTEAAARTRGNTKQAQLIGLMRRPEGATIAQVCTALDWKPHSVRGALAGTLKKRLRLDIRSEKPKGGDRVYRIAG